MDLSSFLIDHGASVWKVALGFFIVAGALFTAARARRRARFQSRLARACLGAPETRLRELEVGATVTLQGLLRVRGEPCARFEDSQPAAATSVGQPEAPSSADARAFGLDLIVDGTTFELEGDITVLVGSREVHRALHRKSAAAVAEASGPDSPLLGDKPLVFRSVADGDVVRVRGELRAEATEDGRTYRDAPRRRTLAGSKGPLLLAAKEDPRVAVPIRTRMGGAIAGGAIFLVAASVLGETLWRMSQQGPLGRDALPTLTVAMATPTRRTTALAVYADILEREPRPTTGSLEVLAHLHQLRGEPKKAALLWLSHGEPERGAELAVGVGAPALAARGYYETGDFERAAVAWEAGHAVDERDDRFGAGAYLLAGNLAGAARNVRRLLLGRMNARTTHAEWIEPLACVADALEARLGDSAAKTRFATRASRPISVACAVLAADLVEGKERTDFIRRLRVDEATHDAPRAWLDLLAAEADPEKVSAPPAPFDDAIERVASPGSGAVALLLPGVERALADHLWAQGDAARSNESQRSNALGRAALFALMAGDYTRASTFTRTLLDDGRWLVGKDNSAPGHEPPSLTAARELAGLVMLSEGYPANAEALETRDTLSLHTLVAFQKSGDEALVRRLVEHDPPRDGDKEAWSAAARGDGPGLGRLGLAAEKQPHHAPPPGRAPPHPRPWRARERAAARPFTASQLPPRHRCRRARGSRGRPRRRRRREARRRPAHVGTSLLSGLAPPRDLGPPGRARVAPVTPHM